MYFERPERTRSHHPADQRRDELRHHHPDLSKLQGWKAMKAEADIPEGRWDEERRWALRMGLTGADSIEDKSILNGIDLEDLFGGGGGRGGGFGGSIFDLFEREPERLPVHVRDRMADAEGPLRAIADHVAGMTDRFALQEHGKLFDPTIRV